MTRKREFGMPSKYGTRALENSLHDRWSDRFNRHCCCKCREDLTNKTSIAGLRGNWCVRCYCEIAKIDVGLFMEAIANRRCYRCDWEYDRNLAITEIRMGEIRDERQRDWEYGRDLANKPAIIQFENGIFQGLLCFRCQYRLDEKNDLASEEKFKAEKQLYGKRYAEWGNRCDKEYAEWENRYGVQWKAQQESAKKSEAITNGVAVITNGVAVVTFLILAYLIFDSTNKWDGGNRFLAVFFAAIIGANIARYIAKETLSGLFNRPAASSVPNPPGKELPPSEPRPPGKRARGGSPELLFDNDKETDSNRWFVQSELFDCDEETDLDPNFIGFEIGDPPGWKERSKECKQRDDNRCCLCGKKENLHVHHVIPKSYGGSHSLQNLVTLCQRCHNDQEYYGHKELIEKSRSRKAAKQRHDGNLPS